MAPAATEVVWLPLNLKSRAEILPIITASLRSTVAANPPVELLVTATRYLTF